MEWAEGLHATFEIRNGVVIQVLRCLAADNDVSGEYGANIGNGLCYMVHPFPVSLPVLRLALRQY